MNRNLNQSFGRGRIGGTPKSGVLASQIPTGFGVPALLLNDIDVSDPPGCEYSTELLFWPSAGDLYIRESGAFTFLNAPDGVYTGMQRVRKNGVVVYDVPLSLSIGITSVQNDYTIAYNTLGNIQKDYSLAYGILASVSQDYSISYNVASVGIVVKDYSVSYDIISSVEKDYSVLYGVLSSITKDYSIAYTIDSSTPVSPVMDFSIAYSIVSSVQKDYNVSYNVLNDVYRDYSITYVINQPAVFVDYDIAYSMSGSVSKNYTITYAIGYTRPEPIEPFKGLLKRADKRERAFYGSPSADLNARIAITTDNGSLLRFDKYKNPTNDSTVTVKYRQWEDDEPFAERVLEIDPDDPRYAVMRLGVGDYPSMFRSRKVYFSCSGMNKVTGTIEVLFKGHIFISP